MTTDLTLNTISHVFAANSGHAERALKSRLEAMGDNPGTTDMLQAQREMHEWTLSTQLQASIMKLYFDACTSIVNRM